MAKKEEEQSEEAPVKKESPMVFVIALVVLAVVAVGAGWFTVAQLKPKSKGEEVAATPIVPKKTEEPSDKDKESDGDKSENDSDAAEVFKSGIIIMDPIIVALKKSDNTFLRIELAIIPYEDADIAGKEDLLRIGSDIAAFTQTLTIQQINGATGFLHYREDILDRVKLVTDGQVKDLLVLSLVAE